MAKDNFWWTIGLFAAGFVAYNLFFGKKVVPVPVVPVPASTVPMMNDDYTAPLYGGAYDNLRGILPSLRVSNRARGCGCNGGH